MSRYYYIQCFDVKKDDEKYTCNYFHIFLKMLFLSLIIAYDEHKY